MKDAPYVSPLVKHDVLAAKVAKCLVPIVAALVKSTVSGVWVPEDTSEHAVI